VAVHFIHQSCNAVGGIRARRALVGRTLLGVACLSLALAGCGGSGQPSSGVPAPSSSDTTNATTTSATASPTTGTTSGSASAGRSTGTIRGTQDGGYTYEATLAFQASQHSIAGDVGACPVDTTTDAEVPGTLTITNTTPRFPAEPGMNLWFGTSSQGFAVVDTDCKDDNTNGAVFYADSPLNTGQSIAERIWLVVPHFYSPDFPSGNRSILAERTLNAVWSWPTQNSDVASLMTSPTDHETDAPNLDLSELPH
jgi:hypothetical protein